MSRTPLPSIALHFLRLPAIVFISLLCHISAPAQQKIRFSRLSIQQGLSQSAVNCIFQDSRGFMWFGTQDGLNRFDGYTFTVFKHNPENPRSLNGSFIASIQEDGNGSLWVTTMDNPKELNKLDRATDGFSHHPANSIDLKGASGSSVLAVTETRAGIRWSGSIGGGVTRLDRNTGGKTVFRHSAGDPNSLIDDRVYSVYVDRSGTLWVGTKEGLDRFDPATSGFVHYRHNPNNPNSISDNWVWPVYEDRSGTLWVGTVQGGLNRFDRAKGTFRSFRHNAANSKSLSDDHVLSVFQDRSGALWIGTGNDGLNLFHPDRDPFLHYVHDVADPRSLMDNDIHSILVDRSGTVWIGSRRGGLGRLDPSSGRFTHFRNNPADSKTPGDNAVQSLLEDRNGTLWLGLFSNGLDRLDRGSKAFVHYRHDPANPHSLSDNRVYALCEDHTGTLWVGTYNGGLNRFDRSTGTFSLFAHSDSLPGSLSANGVWSLYEDREGTLWAGTFGGGLNRFDRATGAFTAYKHDPAVEQSLSDDNILCIHEDATGLMWIGTTGGLNQFDRTSGTFKTYREKNGLPNDVVFGILEDRHGTLWMSTNKGLSRFDPGTEAFRNFDANDGLQGNEFNQNAYCRSATTGEMYFGGINGVTAFHPDSVRGNPYVPPVVFSAFRRYNTDDKEGKPIEEAGIADRREITLTYKDNIAIFEFAALSYFNASKNGYAYKLEGFSDSWIQLGREHRATFTNLDPGAYVLRVRGSNNDGVWNDEGASILLNVTPPWWRTRWAYAVYALMVLGTLYGLRQFEINRREQKAQVRESELRAKAAEAEKRALTAENERKTKELEEARNLQLSMLPREVPKLPHLEIAVFMKTSTEVGGDYYDFQVQADGSLNVAFGDATGHGMQAGTIVTLMKGMFTSDASRLDLQPFFNHCSKAIKGIRLGRLLMSFSMLRILGNKVWLSCAGMPPVFIHRRETGAVDEILLKGMPLGAMKDFPYVVCEETLNRGDTILLLTDGLPEQKNSSGEMFDYPRVQAGFRDAADRTPEDIIKHLVSAGDAWMNGAVQDDDITMMTIRMKV